MSKARARAKAGAREGRESLRSFRSQLPSTSPLPHTLPSTSLVLKRSPAPEQESAAENEPPTERESTAENDPTEHDSAGSEKADDSAAGMSKKAHKVRRKLVKALREASHFEEDGTVKIFFEQRARASGTSPSKACFQAQPRSQSQSCQARGFQQEAQA